ncbi:MAG: hypothetical protein QM698_07575 [Micropepsaceae bacterium]
MRLLSAVLLSTALATGFAATAPSVFVPVAHAQATAGEVDVDALLKLLPTDKVTATYGSKSYDALSGITTIRDLKIADPKAPDRNFFAVQEVGLRGLDLAAFNHVFDFAGYGAAPDESFRQLFGDIVIRNGSVNVEGQRVGSFEEILLGGTQMKQLAAKPPGQFGAPSDEKASAQFLGALLDAAITGEIKVTNLTIEGGPERASIKSLVFGGINRGQFGPSSIDTMESTADGLTTKMASAETEGADFTKVIPWLLKGEMPPVAPDSLLYFGKASVNGLSYEMDGSTVTIGSYTVDPVNFYWLVPSSLKLQINDVYFKPAPGSSDGAAESLGEIGLDHLDIDMGLEWAFDGATGDASLKELRIAESQLFDVALNFDLTGINLPMLIDPASAQSSMLAIGVKAAQLFIRNNGGFDKLLAVAAKEQNSTPDAVRQMALGQLSQLEGGLPQPDGTLKPLSDRVKGIIASLKAFITSPGTLTIKVNPATPINAMTGMGAMFDPISAADTLGVTVESTPQ